MNEFPLVSAICPTTSKRAAWLPIAIRYFREQTYPNRELVVVGDTEVPPAENIRLIPADLSMPIGEKRNLACANSNGEIIAHWDDDDYSAPGRLKDQVKLLMDSGKAVAVYTDMLFCNARGDFWRYKHGRGGAVGTSLIYRKEWWEKNKFRHKKVSEDNDFIHAAAVAKQIVLSECNEMMVATVHEGNTSPRNIPNGSYIHVPGFPGIAGMEWPT